MSNRLFSALDRGHITYSTRYSDRGVPYAGFKWGNDDDSLSNVTAILESDVLRLTAHGLRIGPSPYEVIQKTAMLRWGGVYLSTTDGGADLVIGIYVGSSQDLTTTLLPLLAYLNEARICVESNTAAPALPLFSEMLSSHHVDIRELLLQYGHLPERLQDGVSMVLRQVDVPEIRLEVKYVEDHWIFVHGSFSHERKPILDSVAVTLLQRLQCWTAAGRYVLDSSGNLHSEVLIPLLGNDNKEFILWALAQAALMMKVAAKHLDSPG